jgi:hypothetical protein
LNDTAPARERQGSELDDDIDGGATQCGKLNDSAPARRERQGNESDDDIDASATQLGKLNENALRLL